MNKTLRVILSEMETFHGLEIMVKQGTRPRFDSIKIEQV